MALLSATLLAAPARAQSAPCSFSDKECVREQVVFNIANGLPILNNVDLSSRVGAAPGFASNPAFVNAANSVRLNLSTGQISFINGFIRQNGATLFSRLSALGNGVYLTLINNLLIKAGAQPIP